MLKIRLQRTGRRNNPSFRIVVTESRNGPRSGKFLEILGSHDPRHGKPAIKSERVLHWMGKGAQVSDTVHNILVSAGVIRAPKINVLPKKSPIRNEEEGKEGGEEKENAESAPSPDVSGSEAGETAKTEAGEPKTDSAGNDKGEDKKEESAPADEKEKSPEAADKENEEGKE